VLFFNTHVGWKSLVIPPTRLEIILYYLFLSSVILFNRVKERYRKICLIMGLALILVFGVHALYCVHQRFHPGHLSVTFLSVGQGDSTFILFPTGETMLIDGGGFYGGTFDTGKYIVTPFLLTERVKRLDYLVLTHPQVDHYGGLGYVLRTHDIGQFWVTEEIMASTDTMDLLKEAHARGIPLEVIHSETPPRYIHGVGIRFFNPPGNETVEETIGVNDSSLTFRLEYKEFSLLMTGDIESVGIETCLHSGKELRSTILKAPHHGGYSPNMSDLLKATDPAAVVISCGYQNRYGFPDKHTLKEIRSAGADVFRTDRDGAVIIRTDGESVVTKTMSGKEETWTLAP
jgi:competence protein ComEC